MSEHLGYERHAPEGRVGGNSRNGTRAKTVLTEIGPVEVDVPRDRQGTFEQTDNVSIDHCHYAIPVVHIAKSSSCR